MSSAVDAMRRLQRSLNVARPALANDAFNYDRGLHDGLAIAIKAIEQEIEIEKAEYEAELRIKLAAEQ